MKKKLFSLMLSFLLMLVTVSCSAASYTLPEKMHNQLAIGSGLKGTFRITAEGGKAATPFLNAITDAEFSIRGILSGNDLHYKVFQADQDENQTALSELYRKDGIYYFRSDMVQGKILAFPSVAEYIDTLFPAKGENPTLSSFLVNLFSMSETDRNDQWNPILTRYQNELELWLADFTVQADVVKQENGSSALDFTYVIPVNEMKSRIITLIHEMTTDTELLSLLDTLMTAEEKNLYTSENLLYYYQEALNRLDLGQEIRMNKRVSAMGDVLSSSVEFPLDERTTGYRTLSVENRDGINIYRMSGGKTVTVFALPSGSAEEQQESQKTYWYSHISSDLSGTEKNSNVSVRINLQKTTEEKEDAEERTHLTEHYTVAILPDDSMLPEGYSLSDCPETEEINAELDLHYFSKYSQNSATTLEINASVKQGDSSVLLQAELKTATPWLFMPFEVIDPVRVDAADPEMLVTYFTDWISNAASIVRHDSGETQEAETAPADTETPSASSESTGNEPDPDPQTDSENESEAEAVPITETEPADEEEQEASGTEAV